MQLGEDKNLQFISAVGNVIKKLRVEKTKLSNQEFAYAFDIKQSTLNRIENGKHNSAFYYIWGILEALGVDYNEFSKLLKEELGEDLL